tara:strand:+ start:254 stop:676 length:423 start_codon:yes stop_codon:yes gene_type:complete
MEYIKYGIAIILSGVFSLYSMAHDPKGESFSLSGKITSVELTDGGGTITVSSEAGRYGKVYLTYYVTLNSALPDQGYFSGRGVGFNDGVRQAGSRQGVFRREGAIMKFWSLDDVTDGNMNYCETVMNLETETVEMTFYPF